MEPAFLGSGKHRNIQSIIRLIITDKIASERGATFDHLPGLPMPIQSSLAPRELSVHRWEVPLSWLCLRVRSQWVSSGFIPSLIQERSGDWPWKKLVMASTSTVGCGRLGL